MSTNRFFLAILVASLVGLAALAVPGAYIVGRMARDRAQPTPVVTEPPVVVLPSPTPLPTIEPPTPTVDPNTPGVVSGQICFPSEVVPELTIYFREVNSDSVIEMPIGYNQTSYQKHLPAGTYQVYAWLPGFEMGGSYSEMVKCGLNATCTDHSLVSFVVEPGKATTGINVCDWYGGEGAVPLPPSYRPPTATPTPLPTAIPPVVTTPAPTPTAVPLPCDWAAFVKDVTIPDRTEIKAYTEFTKTWLLKNNGTCRWTKGYKLVFVSGEQMKGPDSVSMPKEVKPGETVEISVKLTAPNQSGEVTGWWMLQNENGKRFGIGPKADGALKVNIKVIKRSIVYDFAAKAGEAVWRTGSGELPFPGTDLDPAGAVFMVKNPKLENGTTENENTLIVQPEQVDNGMISGTYPAIGIKKGDLLKTAVGCLDGAPSCNVTFRIEYRADGGELQKLGEWSEVFDGRITRIKMDLSSLAGKNVAFVFTVLSNGSAEGDRAFWHIPAVLR